MVRISVFSIFLLCVCQVLVEGKVVCRDDTRVLQVGQGFRDKCNICVCGKDGMITCSAEICPGTCYFNGKIHEAGDNFLAGDGCNGCNCRPNGQVMCTQISCDKKPPTRY
ncbi:U-reduvitoxin-Pr21-like isoform X3 [Ostrea edulis]|uniref:U-reduvitoxin-Pr21-like isoform X3 n=1 Tax=Ostrea edulis TaxID=37623 RepID=UPI0024AFC59B|nr:U-reduvitoxin-Pr21-like isoform X3 [Ostrea edulis]